MTLRDDHIPHADHIPRKDQIPRTDPILRVRDLTRVFRRSLSASLRKDPGFTAVDGVSFDLERGEILGLLGESGCGKSTLAGMLMHLIPPTSGKIWLDGHEVQDLSESAFRGYRSRIQMVYQNPFDCLDPSMRIRRLLEEPLALWFKGMDREEKDEKIHAILKECDLPDNCLDRRPGEFSGGQLQRLAIARALLVEPEILIADEIISALDVSVQNQILTFLLRMKEDHQLSVLFITHDLSVARSMSDRVMVMRTGQIRGIGRPEDLFAPVGGPSSQEEALPNNRPSSHDEDVSEGDDPSQTEGSFDPGLSDPYIRELSAATFTFSGSC